MSRELDRDILNYRYCKYLIDDVCANDDCYEYCGEFPPQEGCVINSHTRCEYFVQEDGKGFDSYKDVTDDEMIIFTML